MRVYGVEIRQNFRFPDPHPIRKPLPVILILIFGTRPGKEVDRLRAWLRPQAPEPEEFLDEIIIASPLKSDLKQTARAR